MSESLEASATKRIPTEPSSQAEGTEKLKGPLRLIPNELVFQPPYNRVITNSLQLQNPTSKCVAFKVKTTAPKRYCVRPNTGVVLPGTCIEIQVVLNALKENSSEPKTKDKFQIQTLILDSEPCATVDVKELWSQANEQNIGKHKLKCHFGKSPSPSFLVSANEQQPTVPIFLPTLRQEASTQQHQPLLSSPSMLPAPMIQPNDSSLSSEGTQSPPAEKASESLNRQEIERPFIEELQQVRNEYQKLKSGLLTLSNERDQLKRDSEKLLAMVQAYQQEKQENILRQRKAGISPPMNTANSSGSQSSKVSSSTAPVTTSMTLTPKSPWSTGGSQTTSKLLQQQQQSSQSQQQHSEESHYRKMLSYIIVAIIFFFLGKFI